ncbi:hypothetical protein HAX54_011441, partial [Datura stramonium]|nr:hypothetical protein [Datura stramonium]
KELQVVAGVSQSNYAVILTTGQGYTGLLGGETNTPSPNKQGNYLQEVVLTKNAKYRQQTNEMHEMEIQHDRVQLVLASVNASNKISFQQCARDYQLVLASANATRIVD